MSSWKTGNEWLQRPCGKQRFYSLFSHWNTLSSTSTYPICHCRYDQSIWHKKGSFGFLQKCHWQHRYTNLKQGKCSIGIPILTYKSASYSLLRGQPSYWDKPDCQHSPFKDVSTALLVTIISRKIRNSNNLKSHLTTFTSPFIKC